MQTMISPVLQKEIANVYCKYNKEEELMLIERAQSGCVRSRNALVESQLPAIKKIANFYVKTNPRNEMGDLMSEGTIGLIKAIDLFDASQGVRLFSFATMFIRNEMRDFSVDNQTIRNTRSKSKSRKIGKGDETNYHEDEIEVVKGEKRVKAEIFVCASLDSPMNVDDSNSATIHDVLADENASAEAWITNEDCKKVLRYLNPKQRLFVERHFGLNGNEPTSLADMGKECVPEVSRQTMSMRLRDIMDEVNSMLFTGI